MKMRLLRVWNMGKFLLQFLLPWNCLIGAYCFWMVASSLFERLHIDATGSLAMALVFAINSVRRVVIGMQEWRQGQARHALACFWLASGYGLFAVPFFAIFAASMRRFFPESVDYIALLLGCVFTLIGLRVGRGQLQLGCASNGSADVCLPRSACRTEDQGAS